MKMTACTPGEGFRPCFAIQRATWRRFVDDAPITASKASPRRDKKDAAESGLSMQQAGILDLDAGLRGALRSS
jgi:hypothetical protein